MTARKRGEMMTRSIVLSSFVFVLAFWSGSACADSESAADKARKLVAAAKADYNLGSYKHAAEQFEEAYRLQPDS
jgi:hypothetical protein